MCKMCLFMAFASGKVSIFSAHRKLMHVYLATECKSVAMDTGDLPPRRTYQPAHMATLRSLPTLFFGAVGGH